MLSSRASIQQTTALLDFLEKHPVMQVGPGKGVEHRVECKRLWQEAASMCNCIEGAKKTTKGWIKFWADKKCNVKRLAVLRGSDQLFSPIDKRILSMIGVKRREHRHKSVKREVDVPIVDDFDDEQMSDAGSPENKPIEFVDQIIESEEDRHNALMDKLFQVMSEQASALSKIAEVSQRQAASLERLAECAQQVAGAVDGLARSLERVAATLPHPHHDRHDQLGLLDHHAMMQGR